MIKENNKVKLLISDFATQTELNDFKVYSVDLDIGNHVFKVVIEEAYLFKENIQHPIVMENGGFITVKSYDEFETRYFSPQDKLWHTFDYQNIEPLDEINEKNYENKILKLAGMGKKSGYWIEYLIEGGECEVLFKGLIC